jgi:hypothetical protein
MSSAPKKWQENCKADPQRRSPKMVLHEIIVALALSAMAPQQPAAPRTAGSSQSQTYTGILVDTQNTSCGSEVAKAVPKGMCPPSFGTTNFGLVLQDSKTIKCDEAGNARVMDALRRSKKGASALFAYWRSGKASTTVKARATGTLTGDTLNIEAIQVE